MHVRSLTNYIFLERTENNLLEKAIINFITLLLIEILMLQSIPFYAILSLNLKLFPLKIILFIVYILSKHIKIIPSKRRGIDDYDDISFIILA